MSIIARLCEKNALSFAPRLYASVASFASSRSQDNVDEDGFRILKLLPDKVEKTTVKKAFYTVPPPRCNEMPVDQDWTSVWPGQRSFHPASVPLPLRQGYPLKGQPSPQKYGNAELMKIPNFLHLTPPAIRRHCEALKQFCTEWPAELNSEEACDKHFPLEVITTDYCYSGPSIRDPLARIVNMRVKLSALNLDAHAKDKLLRLLGPRYDPETDYITITADRCPTRAQNLEYAEYLLTAVYQEAWRVEPWEAEKAFVDMEYFNWDNSINRTNLITIHCWPEPPTDVDYQTIPHATEYKVAVTDLINNGEDEYSINKYKESVKNMFNLKSDVINV